MSKKKGKSNKIKKFIKKIGVINILKNYGLIILLSLIAFIMILTIFLSDKFKDNKIEYNKIENNNLINKEKIGTSLKIKKEENKKLEEEKLKKNKLEEKRKIEEKKKKNIFSCNDLLKNGETKSGIYEITVKGNNEKIKVYCDMKTSGGGWTLILTSVSAGWDVENTISRNNKNPSITENYSILEKADKIKSLVGEKFKYRIDANIFGENGGVWEVNKNYSFLSKTNLNTDINILEKYGTWEYSNFGIGERMPYLCNTEFGILSTSTNCTSKWYGTLVAKDSSFAPAPWIHSTIKNPGVIWYWVK